MTTQAGDRKTSTSSQGAPTRAVPHGPYPGFGKFPLQAGVVCAGTVSGMGFLHYGGEVFPLDDRTLVHLQIAIYEARAGGREFYITWPIPRDSGSGRLSAWLTPGIPVLFEYEGSRVPRINRAWVEKLAHSAITGTGLVVTPEPL